MENLITYFKTNGDTNNTYFHYNHLTGVLVMIVSEGCHKGVFTRCDSKAANLARVYHRELEHGVPDEFRLYNNVTVEEFVKAFDDTMDSLQISFHAAFKSF